MTTPAKLTIGQRIAALVQTNSEHATAIADRDTRIAELDSSVAALTAERDTLAAQVATLTQERDTANAELESANASITQLESARQTVSEATVEQVAALGFPASSLPETSS